MQMRAYLSSLPVVLVVSLVLLPLAANALHFYIDSHEKRCFIEELPVDTIVEGHYKSFEWSDEAQDFIVNDKLGIQVIVTETDESHQVVNTRGPSEGRFTFTSHDSGDHEICLQTNFTGGWFSATHVKMYLDLTVGSSRHDTEGDRKHLTDLSQKISDLNKKVSDIRREQQFQRETEANFRDLSELTNSRAVWYSLVQIAVLFAMCVWQTRTLTQAISEDFVTVFSKSYCPYCKRAKTVLGELSLPEGKALKVFELDERDDGADIQAYLKQLTGQSTVPNIFIQGDHLGGCDDLLRAKSSGTLAKKIAPKASL